jgi:hypothetical protein
VVRSTILLCPGASAASMRARWAWYLEGGIASSPTSGACAFATSRRTGGRITSPSQDAPAAGNRPSEWGVAPLQLNQLTFVNGPEVRTVFRPMQAAASCTFVKVTDFPLTLNL